MKSFFFFLMYIFLPCCKLSGSSAGDLENFLVLVQNKYILKKCLEFCENRYICLLYFPSGFTGVFFPLLHLSYLHLIHCYPSFPLLSHSTFDSTPCCFQSSFHAQFPYRSKAMQKPGWWLYFWQHQCLDNNFDKHATLDK